MRKLLRDWFTGVDGETYDLGRAMWAGAGTAPVLVGLVQVLGSFVSLWRPTPLHLWHAQDWTLWATGTSALLLGGAGALSIKKATEPSTTTTRAVVATPGAVAGAATEETRA